MGHKGVSQRKPKKSKLSSNVNAHANKNSSVQTLVKDNSAALSKDDGAKPSDGSNKKDRKGK